MILIVAGGYARCWCILMIQNNPRQQELEKGQRSREAKLFFLSSVLP